MVQDAIARMRQANRAMTRTRISRRDIRLNLPHHHDHVSDNLPYACYFLCDACGWLEDGPTAGDPMRSDRDSAEPGPCPSCHGKSWIDLRKESLALAYRESEAFGGQLLAARGRRFGLWGGAIVSTAALVTMAAYFPEAMGSPAATMTAFVLVWTLIGTSIAALVRRARPGRARPRRWRRPLSRSTMTNARGSDVQGVVEGEAKLQTPLGRDQCVAWSVQVWNDDGQLLDEQHHAALTVDGVDLPSDSVALDLVPRRQLHPAANDEGFVRFMARRGLSPHDSSLRIYESHLVPGVPVTLHRSGGLDHAKLVLCQAPRALAS